MTASEPFPDPPLRPDRAAGRPPGDPPVGQRRLLFAVVLLGLGLLVGGITLLVGGGENVVAARVGIAILLLVVGLVLLARRPSLAAAGLALVLGLLLRANPFYGELAAEWPWQYWFSYGALDHQLDIALWVGVALLVLLRAYLARGRGLVVGAVFLCLLAVTRTHAEGGGMPLLRNEERLDLTWTLAIAALGASALLLARGATGVRRSAAALAVLGACFAATIYLAWFPSVEGGSMVQEYFRRALQSWDALVTSPDASPRIREGMLKDTLGRIAPFWCTAAALPVLLMAALFPRPTRVSRLLGATAFGLLLLRWIVPAVSILYFQREFLGVNGPSIVSKAVGDALTGAGLAAWLLLSSTVSVALEGGGRGMPVSPDGTSAGATRRDPRIAYAIAFGLLLVVMYAAYNPRSGTVAMTWPWDLTWRPFWSLPTAGVVLGGVSLVAVGIALLLRQGPLRAVTALAGLLVGMAALAGPDPRAFLYGVRPVVPQILLALAVGGASAVRGGAGGRLARWLPWAATLFLLALLLYPLPVPTRMGSESHAYRSTVGGIARDLRLASSPQALWDTLVTFYVPGLVLLSLGVMLLSTIGARGTGRRPVLLWVLFGATLAYPALHTAWSIASDPLSRVGGPVEVFLRRVAEDLSVYYVPYALGLAAATGDLLLPWRSSAPTPTRGGLPEPSLPADPVGASEPSGRQST